jgi:hypothetical protein
MDACGSLRLGHGTALSPVPLINMVPAPLHMYQVHKALRGDETWRGKATVSLTESSFVYTEVVIFFTLSNLPS